MKDTLYTPDFVFVPYDQELVDKWKKLGWLRIRRDPHRTPGDSYHAPVADPHGSGGTEGGTPH